MEEQEKFEFFRFSVYLVTIVLFYTLAESQLLDLKKASYGEKIIYYFE